MGRFVKQKWVRPPIYISFIINSRPRVPLSPTHPPAPLLSLSLPIFTLITHVFYLSPFFPFMVFLTFSHYFFSSHVASPQSSSSLFLHPPGLSDPRWRLRAIMDLRRDFSACPRLLRPRAAPFSESSSENSRGLAWREKRGEVEMKGRRRRRGGRRVLEVESGGSVRRIAYAAEPLEGKLHRATAETTSRFTLRRKSTSVADLRPLSLWCILFV